MEEEQSLPPLPAVSWSPTSQVIRTRKRGRDDAPGAPHPTTSSDPAWFSSDDDPSLDNYTQGRRKKRYSAGSWFSPTSSHGQRTLTKPSTKRTFQRQFDSGVWLGSDGTAELEEAADLLSSPTRPGFFLPKGPSRSREEDNARRRIERYLDTSEEYMDLTEMGLKSLSNETIEPLSEFACIPIVVKGVAFEQQEPSLKIFLSRNALTHVPGAIFDLNHLSVLTLRSNKLVELPPAISRLSKLQEANLSQNRLRYLPGDLLKLVGCSSRLKELHVHPNPFCQPVGDLSSLIPQADLSTGQHVTSPEFHQSITAKILARSPVHYTDSTGVSYSHFQVPGIYDYKDTKAVETERLESDPAPPVDLRGRDPATIRTLADDARNCRVPSLMELCLLVGYSTSQLTTIPDFLPEDAPQYIYDAVSRAVDVKESGGVSCCVCGRIMVVPRTAWLEWWLLSKVTKDGVRQGIQSLVGNELAVPFLKQGCSWKCVPRKVVMREWIP